MRFVWTLVVDVIVIIVVEFEWFAFLARRFSLACADDSAVGVVDRPPATLDWPQMSPGVTRCHPVSCFGAFWLVGSGSPAPKFHSVSPGVMFWRKIPGRSGVRYQGPLHTIHPLLYAGAIQHALNPRSSGADRPSFAILL